MSINKRKTAILTFDYEVFMGHRTGTVENCVIRPTQEILKILRKNNGKAIFFVDSAWLIFLKENFHEEFITVSGQLKEIVQSGSTVELHLHPQWLDAVRDGNNISFNSFENYKLHSLSRDQIHQLFRNSIELLESITGNRVRCFRAGGFCIEPFSSINHAFESFGIKYDFSVAPGAAQKEGKIYDYDFTSAPRLPFYSFSNDISKVDKGGAFLEIALATYKNNPIYILANKALLMLKRDSIYGDGTGIQQRALLSKVNLTKMLKFSTAILSLDSTSSLLFTFLLNMHFKRSALIVILSHPKTVSGASLENLTYTTKKYRTLNSIDLDNYFSPINSI
jgi:hypothetical protein